MELSGVRQRWLLFLILLVALYLRLVTVGFGLPALNDPDELMFEMGAVRMLHGHTLNPGWFGHPATTTMYVLAIVNASVFAIGSAVGWFSSPQQFAETIYTDPSWAILPGRVAMVLFALMTIWLTWWLARRFCGPWAGLAAAALLAVDPVHVTWSQIIRSDMMACAFLLLCLRACCAIADTARRRDYLMAASWLGMAVATKWPFGLGALAIVGASVFSVRSGILPVRQAILRLMGAGVAAGAVLLMVSPYLLIDYPTVIRNLQGEGQSHHLGATGGGVWANLWWYISGPIFAGFGVVGLALLAFGALRLRRNRQALAILMPVAGAFVTLLFVQQLVWERWALPLMPLGAIVAGAGFAGVVDILAARARLSMRVAIPALLAAAAVLPLAVHVRAENRERATDTRQLATAWARRHIPAGSTVLIEHFAFDIAGEPWRILFPVGDAGCIDAVGLLNGRTSYAAIEKARGSRANIDYGTVTPARRATCRADFAILTHYDRYRRERRLFPQEYAAYRALLANGSVVATFVPRSGEVGGPVMTIVAARP